MCSAIRNKTISRAAIARTITTAARPTVASEFSAPAYRIVAVAAAARGNTKLSDQTAQPSVVVLTRAQSKQQDEQNKSPAQHHFGTVGESVVIPVHQVQRDHRNRRRCNEQKHCGTPLHASVLVELPEDEYDKVEVEYKASAEAKRGKAYSPEKLTAVGHLDIVRDSEQQHDEDQIRRVKEVTPDLVEILRPNKREGRDYLVPVQCRGGPAGHARGVPAEPADGQDAVPPPQAVEPVRPPEAPPHDGVGGEAHGHAERGVGHPEQDRGEAVRPAHGVAGAV
ncbi:hypothetical protein THAOC_25263, partial [Thalassiosira oceanica]